MLPSSDYTRVPGLKSCSSPALPAPLHLGIRNNSLCLLSPSLLCPGLIWRKPVSISPPLARARVANFRRRCLPCLGMPVAVFVDPPWLVADVVASQSFHQRPRSKLSGDCGGDANHRLSDIAGGGLSALFNTSLCVPALLTPMISRACSCISPWVPPLRCIPGRMGVPWITARHHPAGLH